MVPKIEALNGFRFMSFGRQFFCFFENELSRPSLLYRRMATEGVEPVIALGSSTRFYVLLKIISCLLQGLLLGKSTFSAIRNFLSCLYVFSAF